MNTKDLSKILKEKDIYPTNGLMGGQFDKEMIKNSFSLLGIFLQDNEWSI